MRKPLFNRLLTVASLIFCICSCAQSNLSGVIDNWSEDRSAQVILPTDKPLVVGAVDKNGKVEIELIEEHGEALKKTITSNQSDEDQIRFRIPSVAEKFVCGDDVLQVDNGVAKLFNGSYDGSFYLGDVATQNLYGSIRIASSREFIDSYLSRGRKDYQKGYKIDFYYVDTAASVKGDCEQLSYTLDMKDQFSITYSYDIELQKGWNLVKTEILDLYTDQEARKRPLHVLQQSVYEFPNDATIIFFNNEQP